MEIGEIVIATYGRDKKKYFIVIARLDEQYILICDGTSRKISTPKKKKIKHVKSIQLFVSDDLREKLVKNLKVTNTEIRRNIAQYTTQSEESFPD